MCIKKSQKKLKNQKLCMKMQFVSVFLDIEKFTDFLLKNTDGSKTQGVHHVIQICFGSSLGKA